jgi:hypothetical protein
MNNLQQFAIAVYLVFATHVAFADEGPTEALSTQKIAAAVKYVRLFLNEDANAREVFWRRESRPPLPDDYPALDSCPFQAVVNSIAPSGSAYFESDKRDVVAVPVNAELAMLWTIDAPPLNRLKPSSPKDNCDFEYRLFDRRTGSFTAIRGFKSTPLSALFKNWGEYIYRFDESPTVNRPHPAVIVAPDENHRFVQFIIRVKVDGAFAYRTFPDVPRHWYVRHAIKRLNEVRDVIQGQIESLSQSGERASRFEPNLTIDEEKASRLAELRANKWASNKLSEFKSSVELR